MVAPSGHGHLFAAELHGQREHWPPCPGTTGFEFAGRIDNLRIYNSALTQAQIAADMDTPVGQTSPTDPTPPTVVIDNPINNATVSDIITVTADAADNVSVAGVSYFVDGTQEAWKTRQIPMHSTGTRAPTKVLTR